MDNNLKKVEVNGELLLAHAAGVITDIDMVPVEVYWEENPAKEYFRVDGKKIYTHTVVARAFFGVKPDDKIIRHKDEDICNNSIENLEYVDATQRGERVAKFHMVQNLLTNKVITVFNWYQFPDKDTHRILRTYNKDLSVSFSAKPKPTSSCTHIDCNEKKYMKHSHCAYHRNQLRIIKTTWRSKYNSLDLDRSDENRDSLLKLLDLTTEVSATYGVNLFLQLPDIYSIYDVPTEGTITNLSGEWDMVYTDDYGKLSSISDHQEE